MQIVPVRPRVVNPSDDIDKTAIPLKRAVYYGRVSTDEQKKDGAGLPTNLSLANAYAEEHGLDIVRHFDEAASAFLVRSEKRKAFNEMLAYVKDPKNRIKAVIIAYASRLARNVLPDLQTIKDLEEHGIEIHDVRRRKIITLLDEEHMQEAIRAQGQSKDNSHATTLAMGWKVQAGIPMQQWPVGYRPVVKGGCTYWEHSEQARFVKKAFELFATDKYEQTQVLEMMTAKGLRTKYGNVMGKSGFTYMLTNPRYTGHLTWEIRNSNHGDKTLVGTIAEAIDSPYIKPIVSKELFAKVQNVLETKGYAKRPPDVNGNWPLRGFIRCKCGHALTAGKCKSKTGELYGYYWCGTNGNKHDGHIRVRADVLDAAVITFLESVTPTPEMLKKTRDSIIKKATRDKTEVDKEIVTIRRERNRYEGKIRNLLDKYSENPSYSKHVDAMCDEWQEQIRKCDEEILTLENSVKDAKQIERLLKRAETILMNIANIYEQSDCGRKRIILREVLPHGAAFDGNKLFELRKSLLFKVVETYNSKKGKMASPTRFELVSPP